MYSSQSPCLYFQDVCLCLCVCVCVYIVLIDFRSMEFSKMSHYITFGMNITVMGGSGVVRCYPGQQSLESKGSRKNVLHENTHFQYSKMFTLLSWMKWKSKNEIFWKLIILLWAPIVITHPEHTKTPSYTTGFRNLHWIVMGSLPLPVSHKCQVSIFYYLHIAF